MWSFAQSLSLFSNSQRTAEKKEEKFKEIEESDVMVRTLHSFGVPENYSLKALGTIGDLMKMKNAAGEYLFKRMLNASKDNIQSGASPFRLIYQNKDEKTVFIDGLNRSFKAVLININSEGDVSYQLKKGRGKRTAIEIGLLPFADIQAAHEKFVMPRMEEAQEEFVVVGLPGPGRK